MKRIVIVQNVIKKSNGPLTPVATRLFDNIKKEAAKFDVTWNGGDMYQTVGPYSEQHVVNVTERTCTCRKWDLTGMPCKHAVASIWNMAENGLEPGIPESWVHPTYWLTTWEEMYSFKINPCAGPEMWPPSDSPITLTPPDYHTPIGRPPKKRKKSAAELFDNMVKNGKLIRAGKTVTCRKCNQKGHNSISCTGRPAQAQSSQRPSKPKKTPAAPSQSSQRPSKQKKTPAAPSQSSQRPPLSQSAPSQVAPSDSAPSQVAPSQSTPSQVAPPACIISSAPQVFSASRLSPLKGSNSNVRFSKPVRPNPYAGATGRGKKCFWIDICYLLCLFNFGHVF